MDSKCANSLNKINYNLKVLRKEICCNKKELEYIADNCCNGSTGGNTGCVEYDVLKLPFQLGEGLTGPDLFGFSNSLETNRVVIGRLNFVGTGSDQFWY